MSGEQMREMADREIARHQLSNCPIEAQPKGLRASYCTAPLAHELVTRYVQMAQRAAALEGERQAAESRVAELEAAKARMAVARAEHHNAGVVHEHCGPAEVAYHWGRACPVCLIHDEALAEPRRNALEADL